MKKPKSIKYESLWKEDIIRILNILKNKYGDLKISEIKYDINNDPDYDFDINSKINLDLIERLKLRKKE